MKKKIYKLVLMSSFLIIMAKINAYAVSLKTSTFNHYESTSSAGYSLCQETVEMNKLLTLNNLKVKFTQTDDTYIFKITADNNYDVKNNLGGGCISNGDIHMVPMMYKTDNFGETIKIIENDSYPFASCKSGTMTDYYKLTINNTEIGYHHYSYKLYSDGSFWVEDNTSRDNGDKFFIPNEARFYQSASTYNYKNRTIYPSAIGNNGTGVSMTDNSTKVTESTRYYNGTTYTDSISTAFDTTISIEKDYIDDYRYLCFGATFVVYTSESYGTTATVISGYSMCTNTIDLKNYTSCDHNWVASACNETEHTIKCSLCEWEKKENHNFEYEYDGIENNVCVCTKTKKVHYNYDIYDDIVSTASNVYDVNEILTNIEFSHKTGYLFKWYEKYELQFDVDDLKALATKIIPTKKVLIATTSSLDVNAGNRSVYYKAVYDPIQYRFIYSNKSNLDDYISSQLIYNAEIEPQTFYYDKPEPLKKHIDYDYIRFLGWTLTEGSDKIDFGKEQEVLNFTAENNKTYTLYPIYETEKYKVLYNTLNGYFDNFTQQESREYDFFTTIGILIPHDVGVDKEFSHYIDVNGNRFEELLEIRDYVKLDIENNSTVILFANFKKVVSGNNKSSDDTNDDDVNNNVNNISEGEDNTNDIDNKHNSENGKDNDGDKGNDNDNEKNSESEENKNKEKDGNGDNKQNVIDNNSNNNNGDGNNGNNGSDSSSNNSGGNSGGSIVNDSGNGGGSGGGGKAITSNGSIVNGVLTNNNVTPVDANASTNTTQNTIAYLMNNENTDSKEKTTSTKKISIKNKKKDDKELIEEAKSIKEPETIETLYGPQLLFDPYNYEGNIIRGTHGPWYFEQEYIDKILNERKKKQKELEALANKDKAKILNLLLLLNAKTIAFIGGSLILIIFVILYEISTIKYYRKKREIE